MKKRILAVLICMSIIASLTACTPNEESSSTTTTTTTTATTTKPADNNSDDTTADNSDDNNVAADDLRNVYGPYANDENDFGGRSVRLFFPWAYNLTPGGSDKIDRFLDRVAYYEDKWNFTLEVLETGYDNYIDRYITTTMSGDAIGDLGYIISRDVYPSFVTAGLAYPLSDLNVFDKYTDQYPQLLNYDASSYENKVYGVAENFYSNGTGAGNNGTGVFFNLSLLQRENLEDPHDLYLNGEWTWDKMFELAQAATGDTDGDGEIDQFGMTGRYHQFPFVYSNGGTTLSEENGVFNFSMLAKEAVDALTYYAEKRALPIWGGFGGWDDPMKNFAKGNIAFNISQWWTANSYYKEDQMSDKWGWVPFPAANADADAALYGDEASFLWMPNCVKNPEEVAKVYEAITKDPETDPNDWVSDVETLVRDRKTIQVIEKVLEEYPTKLDLYKGFGLEGVIGGAFGIIERGEQSALAAMESIEQQVYASISDAMNVDLETKAKNNLQKSKYAAETVFFKENRFDTNPELLTDENRDEVIEQIAIAEKSLQETLDSGVPVTDIQGWGEYTSYMAVLELIGE